MSEQRRTTDHLDMTDAQKAFLDQLCPRLQTAVNDAISSHEGDSVHLCEADVEKVVKMTIAAGDFTLPGGQTPDGIIAAHRSLLAGQVRIEQRNEVLDRNVDRILDVVVGPVKTDFLGDPVADNERDEEQGLMAQTATATRAAESLEKHMANGGVPVKLPTSIKAAILGAAATVGAASITAVAIIGSALLG